MLFYPLIQAREVISNVLTLRKATKEEKIHLGDQHEANALPVTPTAAGTRKGEEVESGSSHSAGSSHDDLKAPAVAKGTL